MILFFINFRPVRIIRLVGKNTVDEAILSRAEAKLKLTNRVLNSLGNDSNENYDAMEMNKVGIFCILL